MGEFRFVDIAAAANEILRECLDDKGSPKYKTSLGEIVYIETTDSFFVAIDGHAPNTKSNTTYASSIFDGSVSSLTTASGLVNGSPELEPGSTS